MRELLHRVGVELWGSRAIGEFSEAQAEGIRSKRKVSASKHSSSSSWQNFKDLKIYSSIDFSDLFAPQPFVLILCLSVQLKWSWANLFAQFWLTAVMLFLWYLIISLLDVIYQNHIAGGEDDDGGGVLVLGLLAALPRLLHPCQPLPCHQLQPLHSGVIIN